MIADIRKQRSMVGLYNLLSHPRHSTRLQLQRGRPDAREPALRRPVILHVCLRRLRRRRCGRHRVSTQQARRNQSILACKPHSPMINRHATHRADSNHQAGPRLQMRLRHDIPRRLQKRAECTGSRSNRQSRRRRTFRRQPQPSTEFRATRQTLRSRPARISSRPSEHLYQRGDCGSEARKLG